MKRTTLLLAVSFLAAVGCQRGPQNTVRGAAGQELTVSVPETVTIAQGGTSKFSVTVARKKIDDPAIVKIDGLPKGVTIAQGSKLEFGEGTNDQFVTVEAQPDAPAQKEAIARVNVTAGKYAAGAKLKLSIIESLENKAAHKKSFAAEMEGRLTKAKELLENAETRVKGSKDENKRAVLLKQISDRYESLADARGHFEKMLATPVEVWEREKDEVTSAVARVEKSAQSLVAELKTLKD